MKCPIKKLPVKFNERYEIVDALGNVVVPSLTWKADWAHQRHQALVGVYLEMLINIYGSDLESFTEKADLKGGLTETPTSPTLE